MAGKPGMFKGKRKGRIPQVIIWVDYEVEKLLRLWREDMALDDIIEEFSAHKGVTRGVICGKIWRLRRVLGEQVVPVRGVCYGAGGVRPAAVRLVKPRRYKPGPKAVAQSVAVKEVPLAKDVVPRLAGNNLGLFSGDFGPRFVGSADLK